MKKALKFCVGFFALPFGVALTAAMIRYPALYKFVGLMIVLIICVSLGFAVANE